MTDIAEPTVFLDMLQVLSIHAAGIIGFIGVLIMCYGTAKGLVLFIVYTKRRYELMTEIRIDVAKHLSLGLEFLVGKDIIETIIRPTISQLLVLAFIIMIRTFIAYILSWEMKDAIEEIGEEKELEQAMKQYEELKKKQMEEADVAEKKDEANS